MFPWAGPLYLLASLSPQDSMQHQHRLKHPASRSALILDIEGNVPFVCLPGLEDLAFFRPGSGPPQMKLPLQQDRCKTKKRAFSKLKCKLGVRE